MNIIKEKFKEGLSVVLPIAVLVLVLNFTIIPLEKALLIRFILGVILMLLGLPIFLLGVDIGVTQIGNLTGHTLARSNKFLFILLAGIIMGFIISLLNQVSMSFPDRWILFQPVKYQNEYPFNNCTWYRNS